MLADKLTWFANRIALNLKDQRRHERIIPFQKWAILRSLENGEHMVKILDLSASGISVEAHYIPTIGEVVLIGRYSATVVRHFDGGFAAEFITPFPPEEIDEATRLQTSARGQFRLSSLRRSLSSRGHFLSIRA